jgi:hypothetical protein
MCPKWYLRLLRRCNLDLTSRYVIFQKLQAKQAVSLEATATLDDAKNRLKELSVMFPADYFILDVESECFLILREEAW